MPRKPTADPARAALLAAVLADPEADAPRLVLADWLEEHGEASRAEYVRLSCRLAGMARWDDGYVETRLRADRLLREHRQAWGESAGRRAFYAAHDRGFPNELRFSDETPADRLRDRLAESPVTRAEFSYRPTAEDRPRVDGLAMPELAGLRELELTANVRPVPEPTADAAVRAVAAAANLTHLRRLALPEDAPSPAALADLLASPVGRRLEALALSGERYGDEHAAALAAADLPRLRELRFGGRLTADGLARLVRAGWFPRVERLALRGVLGERGMTALADAGRPLALRSLDLGWCGLTDDALVALAASPHLGRLTELAAERNVFERGDGLVALGESRGFALDALDLSNARLFDEYSCPDPAGTAARFVRGPAVRWLRWLRARGNHGLGRAFRDALAESPLPDSLRTLDLWGCGVFDADVGRLLAGRPWPHLARLDLGAELPWDAALAVVEGPAFPRLAALTVRLRQPGAHRFVKALARSPAAARLRAVDLGAHLTPAAADALVASEHLAGLDALAVRASQKDLARLRARFGPRLLSWVGNHPLGV